MAKPFNIKLSPAELAKLVKLRSQTKDIKVWKRISTIIMSHQGLRAQTIAQTLGITQDTVTDHRRRWLQGGFFQLSDAPRSGRPPRANGRYIRELKRIVTQSPLKFGYYFTIWSAARLGAHLKRATGISLGTQRIRAILREQGFVYRRPKYTVRNKRNLQDYGVAKRRLQCLKKRPSSLCLPWNSGLRMK